MAAPLQGPTPSGATLDTTQGTSSNWGSVLGGIAGAIGGYVAGSNAATTAARNNQTKTNPSQSNAQWLWIGVAVLGGVLLFVALRK